jgi:NTE family protein
MTSSKRALVLGGGGLVGTAWESGLCAGLFERGVDLRTFDLFVGTSAGAIVSSQLAAGRFPQGPNDKPRPGSEGAAVDPSKIDGPALGAAFTRWSKIERTTVEDSRGIGGIARTLYRDGEARWVSGISAAVGVEAWPDKPLYICTVDTESGERVVLEGSHGHPLGSVVAASCSVPGIFPSVLLGTALYMDGQVHSSTNADVLLPHAPLQVLIAMPSNTHTAPGIGRHAEREVQAEIDKLRAAGCEVRLVQPSAEDGKRTGRNLMDPARVKDAYAVGLETGRALSPELG